MQEAARFWWRSITAILTDSQKRTTLLGGDLNFSSFSNT